MITLKPYEILVYNDVPQLFIAVDKIDVKYICMEVESGTEENEYVAITISTKKLNRLFSGKIDLRETFIYPETESWYKVTQGGEDFIAILHNFNAIEERYLPLEGFYVPSILQSSHAVRAPLELIKKIELFEAKRGERAIIATEMEESEVSPYVQLMRKEAIYFTLEPVNLKFGRTINPKDAVTLLESIPKSFKEYCKDDFYQYIKSKVSDLKKIEKSFNDAWQYLNLRICDLGFKSFKVALAADVMHDRSISKDVKEWKENVVNKYRNDVIDVDFSSEEDAAIISNKFPDPEVRKRIFEPIIKVMENPNTTLKVNNQSNTLDKTLKIGKKQREIIIPQPTVEELELDKFSEKQIIHMYFEVPKDKAFEGSLSKKQIEQGLLFSQITNEFPLVFDKVEHGDVIIELNSPLYLYAHLENNVYTLEVEALDIQIDTPEKDRIYDMFNEMFINKYAYYSKLPQTEEYEEYKKIVAPTPS